MLKNGEKLVTLQSELTSFSHVNGSPRFVKKCMKSWLAQGSSGRRVTISPHKRAM